MTILTHSVSTCVNFMMIVRNYLSEKYINLIEVPIKWENLIKEGLLEGNIWQKRFFSSSYRHFWQLKTSFYNKKGSPRTNIAWRMLFFFSHTLATILVKFLFPDNLLWWLQIRKTTQRSKCEIKHFSAHHTHADRTQDYSSCTDDIVSFSYENVIISDSKQMSSYLQVISGHLYFIFLIFTINP